MPLGADLAERFHRAHEERYGYADREREIELVAVRTADVVRGPELTCRAANRNAVRGRSWSSSTGATCWVPAGWSGADGRSHGHAARA